MTRCELASVIASLIGWAVVVGAGLAFLVKVCYQAVRAAISNQIEFSSEAHEAFNAFALLIGASVLLYLVSWLIAGVVIAHVKSQK